MGLIVNDYHLAGEVCGTLQQGRDPLPWLYVEVMTAATVWDRHGRTTTVEVRERVVLQGPITIKAVRPRLTKGTTIYVTGQRVPAYTVTADTAGIKGLVLLATSLQIIQ